MDKVLNDLVPAMTSNTSSVGTAYVSPNNNDYPPYMMFDKSLETYSGTTIRSSYPHYYGMNFNINKMIYANEDLVLFDYVIFEKFIQEVL